MQTSIHSTTDSTQHGDLPRTENDEGNLWKRLRSSLGLARDDGDDVNNQPLRSTQPGCLSIARYSENQLKLGGMSCDALACGFVRQYQIEDYKNGVDLCGSRRTLFFILLFIQLLRVMNTFNGVGHF